MRIGIIAAASVIALLGGSALAQTSTSSPPGAARPPGATQPAAPPKVPAVNPLTTEDVSKISGTNVYGTDDKKLGSVATALMDPKSKTIDRLVVSEGGVLGMGAHKVALPVGDFSWDGQKEGFKLAKTADELKSMPEWQDHAATASAGPAASSSGTSTPPASETTKH